jgi:Bax protein
MLREIHFRETPEPIRWRRASINCKSWLMLAIFIISVNSSFAQSSSFIHKYRPMVDSLSDEYGIPSAVILSISIIESASGTSRNCKLLNNYFGIEGKNNLKTTRGIKTRYKQYPDAKASFADFCRLMTKKKFYKQLKGNMNDKLWIDAISKAGYSEAPVLWKERITATIRKHKLSGTH